MNKIVPNKIILHHSLTRDSRTMSWQAIRKFHMSYAINGVIVTKAEAEAYNPSQVKTPYRDIGYTFGIEDINGSLEVLCGRMLGDAGAHTRGQNSASIGICCVGNFDIAAPSKGVWNLTLKLVRSLMFVFKIPAAEVYGHREFASYKSCPGKKFNMEKFRKELVA